MVLCFVMLSVLRIFSDHLHSRQINNFMNSVRYSTCGDGMLHYWKVKVYNVPSVLMFIYQDATSDQRIYLLFLHL